MNETTAIELHDSVLQDAKITRGDVTLMLDAYVHRSAGTPGVDAGSGWRQRATIVLRGFRGNVPSGMSIAAGRVLAAGRLYDNVVPAPLAAQGAVSVELEGTRGEEASLSGASISLDLLDDPTYVEAFPGSEA